jgi:hypothetical protein
VAGTAGVADRAEQGLNTLLESLKEIATTRSQRIRAFAMGGFPQLRQRLIDRG